MARGISIEQQLSQLSALAADPRTPQAQAALREALAHSSNLIVARAADIAGRARLAELTPLLAEAFHRFMSRATDRGCMAKHALARALDLLSHDGLDLFRAGVRHVQLEPGFGGPSDAAVGLRCACAAALVRLRDRRVLDELAGLLADDDAGARVCGARLVAEHGDEAGAALLRLRVLVGDAEPSVTGECLAALLRLTPTADALDFVESLADRGPDELREAALLALGESKLPEALRCLRRRLEAEPIVLNRRTILLAIALTRQAESLDLLVGMVSEADPTTASAAVEALAFYRGDSAVRSRIESAVDGRHDPPVIQAFVTHFGRGV
jgi:hypothetical protein